MFKCRRFISGAPELQDLYLGQNAMHTVRRGVARDLLLLPHHVGQLAQFSHLAVLELGGFIYKSGQRTQKCKDFVHRYLFIE